MKGPQPFPSPPHGPPGPSPTRTWPYTSTSKRMPKALVRVRRSVPSWQWWYRACLRGGHGPWRTRVAHVWHTRGPALACAVPEVVAGGAGQPVQAGEGVAGQAALPAAVQVTHPPDLDGQHPPLRHRAGPRHPMAVPMALIPLSPNTSPCLHVPSLCPASHIPYPVSPIPNPMCPHPCSSVSSCPYVLASHSLHPSCLHPHDPMSHNPISHVSVSLCPTSPCLIPPHPSAVSPHPLPQTPVSLRPTSPCPHVLCSPHPCAQH